MDTQTIYSQFKIALENENVTECRAMVKQMKQKDPDWATEMEVEMIDIDDEYDATENE